MLEALEAGLKPEVYGLRMMGVASHICVARLGHLHQGSQFINGELGILESVEAGGKPSTDGDFELGRPIPERTPTHGPNRRHAVREHRGLNQTRDVAVPSSVGEPVPPVTMSAALADQRTGGQDPRPTTKPRFTASTTPPSIPPRSRIVVKPSERASRRFSKICAATTATGAPGSGGCSPSPYACERRSVLAGRKSRQAPAPHRRRSAPAIAHVRRARYALRRGEAIHHTDHRPRRRRCARYVGLSRITCCRDSSAAPARDDRHNPTSDG